VIELDPKNALAYARRGVILLEKKDKVRAASDLRTAIALDASLKTDYGVFLTEAMKK